MAYCSVKKSYRIYRTIYSLDKLDIELEHLLNNKLKSYRVVICVQI